MPVTARSKSNDRESMHFGHLASPSPPLEPPACYSGLVDRVLGVAMAEVVLDQPKVRVLLAR